MKKKRTQLDIMPFVTALLRSEGGIRHFGEDKSVIETFEENRERMYSDDPDDRGGATLCGVTLTALNEWAHRVMGPSTTYTADELLELPYHIWLEVVKTLYWKELRCNEYYDRPHLALAVADYGFNSGTTRAARCLQEVLNGMNQMSRSYVIRRPDENGVIKPQLILLDTDGIVGPLTLNAIAKVLRHGSAEEEAVHRICDRRRNFITRCVERGTIHEKFLDGLIKRVDYIERIPRWQL